jgi:hypothetical protein
MNADLLVDERSHAKGRSWFFEIVIFWIATLLSRSSTLIFLLFLLGEFTVKADPGKWIDYARTGRLSENRYLLFQHVGNKGTYDRGTEISVLDGEGEHLYYMPEAENAWVVRNNLMGDEDLLIFQKRLDPNWYLWHPVHGVRAIEGEPNLGREKFKAVSVSQKGKLYFLNEFENAIEIEEIVFTASNVAELFVREALPFRHRNLRLEGKPRVFPWSNGFMLHFPFTPSGAQPSSFFRYTFDETESAQFSQIEMGIPFTSMYYLDDWYSIFGWAEGGSFIALHDGQRAWLKMSYGETEVQRTYREFNRAFNRGYIAIDGPRMRYVLDGQLHELDLENFRFNTYQLTGRWRQHEGWANPDNDRLHVLNHKIFRITKVPPLRSKDMVLMESLVIPARFRGDVRPGDFTGFERDQ